MDGLLILSIETATGCGSVALSRGTRLLAEATAQPEVTHSRRLLGTVSWLMQAAAVTWSELDAIGVSLGPGSFTGLRIGLAAAKGLAMAADIPLVGVDTLDALALACAGVRGRICPVLDARKQEVYAAMYQVCGQEGYPVRLSEDKALAPEALVASIDRPTVLAGPAVAVYADVFSANDFVQLLPTELVYPRALYVGLLAEQKIRNSEVVSSATLQPKYVRAPEAEINLRRKQEQMEK